MARVSAPQKSFAVLRDKRNTVAKKYMIYNKVPATHAFPFEEKVAAAADGLFGQMPSALAPKGTRLSLKMPAAFPKVNRRMRWRGGVA